MDEIIYKGIVFQKPNCVKRINRAYNIVHKDIKKGKLQRMPCEVCGNQDSEVHHEDYSDDYKIRWLCHKHHKIIHSLFKSDGVEKIEVHTVVNLRLSKDEDYLLNRYQAKLAKMNLKQSKAELLVKMAMIGLLQEDEKLTEYINK